METKKWTRDEAVEFCFWMEKIAPSYGCHIALTGGLLYKEDEPRKDLDIIVYRIRQVKEIDVDGLFVALDYLLGVKKVRGWGFVVKAVTKAGQKQIDFLFPEEIEGEYLADED